MQSDFGDIHGAGTTENVGIHRADFAFAEGDITSVDGDGAFSECSNAVVGVSRHRDRSFLDGSGLSAASDRWLKPRVEAAADDWAMMERALRRFMGYGGLLLLRGWRFLVDAV